MALAERLSQMVDAADHEGAAQQTAIARRHSADGMLQSGNFFIAEQQALKAIYQDTLRDIAEYALSIAAPSVASRAVRTAALELESRFLNRFEEILKGSASGNPCPANAATELLSNFRTFVREKLNSAVSDVANNIPGKPVRGWQGWINRYGWNAINTGIAALALYWAWGKK